MAEHRFDIGRSNAPNDRREAVWDTGSPGRSLDIPGKRLAGLLAVGSVVDEHRHTLVLKSRNIRGGNLAAHPDAIAEAPDHCSNLRNAVSMAWP
jgi:hypothetical protein